MANKQFNGREVKAITIRDLKNHPIDRQALGYFKHLAIEKNKTQMEFFAEVMEVYYDTKVRTHILDIYEGVK